MAVQLKFESNGSADTRQHVVQRVCGVRLGRYVTSIISLTIHTRDATRVDAILSFRLRAILLIPGIGC